MRVGRMLEAGLSIRAEDIMNNNNNNIHWRRVVTSNPLTDWLAVARPAKRQVDIQPDKPAQPELTATARGQVKCALEWPYRSQPG